MADATRLHLGAPCLLNTGNASFSNFALDATTDAVEFIVEAPAAITITRLGFRYGARTGTPPTYRISIQGVGATGNPDGTIKGAGTPASATFTPPASAAWNGTWNWVTLDNPYTCARGEFLAIVIDYSAGSVDGSNNSSFTSTASFEASPAGFPYVIQNNATVRTRQGAQPVYGYGSAGTAYGAPMQSLFITAMTSATTPDEYALAFTLSASYGSTFQVAGARACFQSPAAGSIKVILYSGTTVLQSVTVDTDAVATAGSRPMEIFFADAALTDLSFGSLYRIGFQPQDAAGNYFLFGITMAAAADAAAFPGGTQFHLSSRVDAGAWSNDLATRPMAELILADLTVAAAGVPMSRVALGM